MYQRVVISSGHGKYIRGAADILDEVDEARRVVDAVASALRARGVDVKVFHDNTSHDQNTNLNTIVNYHNAQTRDLDVSVHFNAYQHTTKGMGTECLYVTQEALAAKMADAISMCGFIDRGPKYRSDLFFLNNTEAPAILIETCFVDSVTDADLYDANFGEIVDAIATVLGGESNSVRPPDRPERPDRPGRPPALLVDVSGACSHFGGPADTGVSPSEGLAFIFSVGDAPHLFLPYQPEGTTGLARRLNPTVPYVAVRWDYDVTPKSTLLDHRALVENLTTGVAMLAFPADWGPNENTGREADLSPGLLEALGLKTDDMVRVTYPYPMPTGAAV